VAPRTVLVVLLLLAGCSRGPEWERANPVRSLPEPPLGISTPLQDLPDPPTPERVRLGRWLFYDTRLSADGTVSCGTCHQPGVGFSEPTPISTGVHGQRGSRKSPPILNLAFAPLPHFFWDGRAGSLEAQALGPIGNPVEMGLSEDRLLQIVRRIPAYAQYFEDAFGDDGITADRIVKALADYERTRMAGNSAWDRWRAGDDDAVSADVKKGHDLFFGRAACSTCHLGESFTDGKFHNLGVGWNEVTRAFTDAGRHGVTKQEVDLGAFKTPTLRDVSRHAPYMHDGSVRTLREVVELYDRGGTRNPWLSAKIFPLGLTDHEIDALVAFLKSLDSDLPVETPPAAFPR
jgi:cytochrome c peroxidase